MLPCRRAFHADHRFSPTTLLYNPGGMGSWKNCFVFTTLRTSINNNILMQIRWCEGARDARLLI